MTRRLAGSDPEVNEEWNCDKGRWAFTYATEPDRLVTPLVGTRRACWPRLPGPRRSVPPRPGLAAARGRAGVLTGGRLTLEDAYAYAKFARLALGTNDIDMRARPHSAEEAQFLGAAVAGRDIGVSYADLERAPAVLLAGFEPEEESPIVFLRLRKAVPPARPGRLLAGAVASGGLARMGGTLLPTVPGAEAAALRRLAAGRDRTGPRPPGGAGRRGAVILVGERLAEVPGALTAAAALAESTGAQLAWIPRRAGERGAIEAGALPGLLPGGRSVADPAHAHRGGQGLGRGLAAARARPGRRARSWPRPPPATSDALVIAGVDPDDLPDPAAALAALDATPVHRQPGAAGQRGHRPGRRGASRLPRVAEKAGTFVNWEGRPGTFGAALPVPSAESDLHVLGEIADEMDVHLGLPDAAAARAELAALGSAAGRAPRPGRRARSAAGAAAGAPRRAGRGGTVHLAPSSRRRADAGR